MYGYLPFLLPANPAVSLASVALAAWTTLQKALFALTYLILVGLILVSLCALRYNPCHHAHHSEPNTTFPTPLTQ